METLKIFEKCRKAEQKNRKVALCSRPVLCYVKNGINETGDPLHYFMFSMAGHGRYILLVLVVSVKCSLRIHYLTKTLITVVIGLFR